MPKFDLKSFFTQEFGSTHRNPADLQPKPSLFMSKAEIDQWLQNEFQLSYTQFLAQTKRPLLPKVLIHRSLKHFTCPFPINGVKWYKNVRITQILESNLSFWQYWILVAQYIAPAPKISSTFQSTNLHKRYRVPVQCRFHYSGVLKTCQNQPNFKKCFPPILWIQYLILLVRNSQIGDSL